MIHAILEEYGVGLGCVHNKMANDASLFARDTIHVSHGDAVDDICIGGLADNETIGTLRIDIVIHGFRHTHIANRGIQRIAKQS